MGKDEKGKKENPRTYLLTSEQLMMIMRYLASKPYAEVATIMSMLSTLVPLDPRISADFVKGDSDGKE
jgi:hypothetical protein